MSSYLFTHSRSIGSNRKIFTAMPFYVGRVSLMFMLMVFIAVLGLLYLVNFNSNATVGYELTRLEFERNKLMTIQEQNNINLSRSQSLEYIKQSSHVSQMVPVNTVEYYDTNGALAVNYR